MPRQATFTRHMPAHATVTHRSAVVSGAPCQVVSVDGEPYAVPLNPNRVGLPKEGEGVEVKIE